MHTNTLSLPPISTWYAQTLKGNLVLKMTRHKHTHFPSFFNITKWTTAVDYRVFMCKTFRRRAHLFLLAGWWELHCSSVRQITNPKVAGGNPIHHLLVLWEQKMKVMLINQRKLESDKTPRKQAAESVYECWHYGWVSLPLYRCSNVCLSIHLHIRYKLSWFHSSLSSGRKLDSIFFSFFLFEWLTHY